MNANAVLFYHARDYAIEHGPVAVHDKEIPLVIAAESYVVETVCQMNT